MFGQQFYPTPRSVIKLMIDPLLTKWEYGKHHREIFPFNRILEPSAGRGDILDYITTNYGDNHNYNTGQFSLRCIEIDPDLRNVLIGKKYTVIDKDFLAYNDYTSFDLIIMNPPFAHGAKHLLHAWDILDYGYVVCVLNAQTIRNPNNARKKLLLEIIKQHGRYEFHSGEFSNADNKTNVEIALVWLHKEKKDQRIKIDNIETDKEVNEEDYSENALATKGGIQNLVTQHELARDALINSLRARSKYMFYCKGIHNLSGPKNINILLDELRTSFWKFFFTKTQMGNSMTSDFQKKIDTLIHDTSNMSFSVENITSIMELFVLNHEEFLTNCIIEVFDKITALHEKNTVYHEGWVTNKSWKIANKIIHPYGISYENRWGGSFSANHYREDFYLDLDRAMCHLTGRRMEKIITVSQKIRDRMEQINYHGADYRELFYSTFFSIKVFKKGTVHLKFLDQDLCDRFNIVVAENKNWLGDGS